MSRIVFLPRITQNVYTNKPSLQLGKMKKSISMRYLKQRILISFIFIIV